MAPGGLDLDVLVGGEQRGQPLLLPVGAQAGAGVQDASSAVERVAGAAAVPVQVLLHPTPAAVQGVGGQVHDVEGVHHRGRLRQFLGGGGLESGEPVHRHHLQARTPGLGPGGEPGLERLLGAALDHVQQPGRARAVPHRCQVDDHGDVLVAAAGVSPHVLVDPDDLHAVEPAGVVDQDALAFGQDGVVGGVPGDPETLGDAGDGQVLAHEALQRPPQASARQLGPRLGRPTGVLAPHVPAATAPVTADRDQQRHRTPPQRLVRQPSQDGVARRALAAAAAAPLVGCHDATRQHRTIRLEPLPEHLKAELVQSAERGQVRASEGSVRQVEVFRMGGVRTSIFKRPRPLPGHRRAAPLYTLICEEPTKSS